MSNQKKIDPYREMNRYDGRDREYPSDAVFKSPQRTLGNGWRKFHADRDCGCKKVAFVEETNHRPSSENFQYRLYCWACGYRIPEDEVLFIGGEWWSEIGGLEFRRPIEDLHISRERVCELGPDPDQEELKRVLKLQRIEREGNGLIGFSFGNGTWYECEDCGNEAPLTYDGKCRMCYDGEWTQTMQDDIEVLANSVRVQNNSFVHRLENHVDPFSIKDRLFTEKVLWRRSSSGELPKVVEVAQCLKDDDDGHWEYVLSSLDGSDEWLFSEDEIRGKFWDTGLYMQDGFQSAKGRFDDLTERNP